jgi:predicted nucleic acid-binding protein
MGNLWVSRIAFEKYPNLCRWRMRAAWLAYIYWAWRVEVPTAETVLRASEIQERNQLSFWDAMILATAVQGGAETLLSEDMNHGQVIEGIRVENPFLH